jgi:hypothetical protein
VHARIGLSDRALQLRRRLGTSSHTLATGLSAPRRPRWRRASDSRRGSRHSCGSGLPSWRASRPRRTRRWRRPRKDYYEQVDELREAIEAKLRAWSKAVDASQAKAESGGTATRTLIERLHGRIQAELRKLRPVMEDLRGRAQHAEQEARRLAKEWNATTRPPWRGPSRPSSSPGVPGTCRSIGRHHPQGRP